jgi:hypothetical protein
MVYSTNSDYLAIQYEMIGGRGLRNRIDFRPWAGRSGAEILQGRQGREADHSAKFGAGVKKE